MRTVRIYQEGHYEPDEQITLSEPASHHVSVVLRMTQGEPLILFRGDNREFLATIQAIQKKKVIVSVDEVRVVNRESPCLIHLAQAISKGDRMEFVVQKATELGVSTITPIISTRCNVKLNDERLSKKQMQWQSVAIGACEQSGRNQVPIINSALLLDVFLQQCQTNARFILHPHVDAQVSPWRSIQPPSEISLMIGPEGGFTQEEVELAMSQGFRAICLGPRILRTETAAIAAISVLQSFYENW